MLWYIYYKRISFKVKKSQNVRIERRKRASRLLLTSRATAGALNYRGDLATRHEPPPIEPSFGRRFERPDDPKAQLKAQFKVSTRVLLETTECVQPPQRNYSVPWMVINAITIAAVSRSKDRETQYVRAWAPRLPKTQTDQKKNSIKFSAKKPRARAGT